jgi:hypothetical protein
MRKETYSPRSFLVEFGVYGALVTGYFFLVLHLLGGWLLRLFQSNRPLYAAAALGLIIGQGVVLELLTRLLLAWVKPRAAKE